MKFTKAFVALLCLCLAGFGTSWAAPASPQEKTTIKVLSSAAPREIFIELFAQFEKQSGYKIEMETSGSVVINKRVDAGDPFDMVVLASGAIDKQIAAGKVKTDSKVDIAKSGIGIAVRKGAKTPDVGTEDALKQALLASKTIGYSTGPSGIHILDLLKRWGIADQVKDRLVQVPPGVLVASIVADGKAEIGFQQLSELVHSKGIALLGPLPASAQLITVWSAGISATTKQEEAVKQLLQFLTSPTTAETKTKNGMEPI